jgi:hypothetical protein
MLKTDINNNIHIIYYIMEFIKKDDTRYVSMLKNMDGKPLIEVDVKDGDTLYLKFIYGDSSGTLKLDDLLQEVKCFAKSVGKQYIHLEDDSMFPIEDNCKVHSLMLRAFINKNGLYYDRGFYPTEDRDIYEKLRLTIYQYPLNLVSEFVNDLQFTEYNKHMKEILVTKLNTVNDTELFGEWLLTQECLYYKKLMDLIMNLARLTKVYPSTKTNNFLKAYRDYYLINQNLKANAADCYKGGVRRVPKVSRRRTHKRRMSGKNRRNHNSSSRNKQSRNKQSRNKQSRNKQSRNKQKRSHRYRRI